MYTVLKKMWCFRKCFRKKQIQISSEIYYKEDCKLIWQIKVPLNNFLLERICYESSDIFLEKYRIIPSNEIYTELSYKESLDILNEKIKKPWIWIGSSNITMTEELDKFLVKGNLITLDILSFVNKDIQEWEYLTDELEMKKFPSEGILISDDTNKERIKKEA